MCCNIPSNHEYYLTDFCGGYPHSQTSCGEYCDQYKYFTADRQRFGCNGYLQICGRGKCLKAKVIDAGPADWVEEKAGKAIIDASPAVCSHITGRASCGWSDHFLITAVPVRVEDESELGPMNITEEEYNQIVEEMQRASVPTPVEDTCPGKTAVPCCTPPQWEGYQFSWDPKHHFRIGLNISYDYTNKRARLLFEERRGERKRIIETIALFDEKKLYTIEYENKTCRVEPLDDKMEQDCIPTDAKHEAEITIGGSLPANVWVYKGRDFDMIDIRTKESCIPVDVVSANHRIGVDVSVFWDITAGISDPAVFNPPSICRNSQFISPPKEMAEIFQSVFKGKMWKP